MRKIFILKNIFKRVEVSRNFRLSRNFFKNFESSDIPCNRCQILFLGKNENQRKLISLDKFWGKNEYFAWILRNITFFEQFFMYLNRYLPIYQRNNCKIDVLFKYTHITNKNANYFDRLFKIC